MRSRWDPLFAQHELVGGRYEIVRFLAGGGAGEVYEVEDRELGGRVALKALRHAVSGDPRRFERFRREILLARKVTHPNVCRLHDAGHHVRDALPASSEGQLDATRQVTREEVFFLTMELLAGETLATRLASDGRLPAAEALPILRQIAAGLDAAHAAGVIHRDLKSANVMLVPQPNGLRAVVTDFGLARAGVGTDEPGSSGVTLSGTILGTPSYMAPEQVEGGEITAAADVYAFGVMMFETVTGALPFHGDSALSIAMARLKQEPPSPRTLSPELDARWERVIGACMARYPADRPASAGAAVAALASENTDLLLPHRPRSGGRAWALALGAVLLAGTAALWLWRDRGRPPAPPTSTTAVATAPRIRPAVAVLGFKNNSKDHGEAWLSTAFAEMLSSEIAAGERVRTVPGETVARVKAELTLPDTDSLAADTLQRLRTSLGSDYVLLGSYVALSVGQQIRLTVTLQNTANGETVLQNSQVGTQDQLFAMVGRAGEALRGNLGNATGAADAAAATRPANPAAAHWYAEGLAALRLYDAAQAREALMQAVSADPQYPFAYAALAEAWKRLGYDTRAAEASERAIALAANLPREQRLLIEGRARLTAKDPSRAAAIYRELADAFPDDPDHPLHMAEALIESGDPRGALELLTRHAALPGGDRDPRLAISQALALNRLSDFAHQLDAAQRAIGLGSAARANLLVARARHFEGTALQSLGRPVEARAALENALNAYQQAGDRFSVAQEQRALAGLLRAQGDPQGALRLAEKALATCVAIGARAEEARALNTIANIEYQQGNVREAAGRYEKTLAIFKDIADRHGEAAVLSNLGNARYSLGDFDAAIAAHTRALLLKREEGGKQGIAVSLIGLAVAQHALGDLASAAGHLEEALAISRESGDKATIASSLFTLGNVLLDRGDIAGAGARHRNALALRNEIGERSSVADSRIALARVAIEEGAPDAIRTAAATLVDAATELHAENSSDSEAEARATLARCLRLEGDTAAARAELARAAELAAPSDDKANILSVEIERGRLDGATGQRPAAIERLRASAKQAQTLKRLGIELEARLALAELGTPAEREAVAAEAAAHGFGLIAAHARAGGAPRPARPR